MIGLSAKNGILIVEFANQLRKECKGVNQAIIEAATIRLRPILKEKSKGLRLILLLRT